MSLTRGHRALDNLFQVVQPIVIPPIPLDDPVAPLRDFFVTLSHYAAAAPHGHTVTNPNMPTPELIERLIIPMTPINATDFQESSTIRIRKNNLSFGSY